MRLAAALAVLSLVPAARAQLVVGNGNDSAPNMVWYVDVATGDRTPLFAGPATAIAVDDPSGVVYVMRGTVQLWKWSYGSTQPPSFVGQTHLASGQFAEAFGLAFGNGRMFGANPFGTPHLMEVDPSTLVATPIAGLPSWFTPESLSFDPLSGSFYAYVDSQASASPGLYTIDLFNAGQPVLAAPPPASYAYADGDAIAVGNGHVYVMGDDWQPYDVFDLATSTYAIGALWSPFSTDGLTSGADWAPSLVPPAAPRVYCEGKLNSNGCEPKLVYSGSPSAAAGSAFEVIATRALAGVPVAAHVRYSLSGRAATPFSGGTLCVAPPLRRTPIAAAIPDPTPNLVPGCQARFRFDFNAYIASGADPALVAGQNVWLQVISRDPGFAAPNSLGLSPALELAILP